MSAFKFANQYCYGNAQSQRITGPQCKVTVINPCTLICTDVVAILDTGATITLLPEPVIVSVGRLESGERIQVRVENGMTRNTSSYIVNLAVGDFSFENIDVISTNRAYAIVGRDILNRHKFVLDAITGYWKVDCRGCV
jgi:hypothetical protein